MSLKVPILMFFIAKSKFQSDHKILWSVEHLYKRAPFLLEHKRATVTTFKYVEGRPGPMAAEVVENTCFIRIFKSLGRAQKNRSRGSGKSLWVFEEAAQYKEIPLKTAKEIAAK